MRTEGADDDPGQLTWRGAEQLPASVAAALMGPGAPFELVTETMLGRQLQVFAQRPRSLRAVFDATVARQPDAIFMVDADRSWTFAEAVADVDAVGRVLVERYGVGTGDRVGIVAANSPEYGLAMWAALSIGAVVAGLNGWWTGHELHYGIELAAPKVILGDEPRLARLAPDAIPDGVPVVTLEAIYAQARAVGNGGRSWTAEVDEDDPMVILFTSGTTGRPKGATLSHRNLIHFAWANMLTGAIGAMTSGAPRPVTPTQPVSIMASPMFHVSGMVGILMTGGMLGAKLVFPPPGRWEVTRHFELTQTHRVTTWSGVPTQFWRLLRDPDFDRYDVSSVLNAGGGGAPFPPELVREFLLRMPWVTLGNGYGMSETAGMGTRTGGPLMVEHPESVGGVNPTLELEIRDEQGRVLPVGDVGEIYLRSASVFLGYWNDPAATAACLDAAGWYRTGDFGRVDKGMLYLASRIRDLIIRGGENIYPTEIEHRLVEHPDIDDAAVIGVDHHELGQEVKAFVIRRDGANLTAADVQSWASETLARFKVPAHVEFRSTLPYTETGKVLKHQLETEERARTAAL